MIELLEPMWLTGIIPVVIILSLIVKKNFTKVSGDAKKIRKAKIWVLASRIIIISLIFIALSKPADLIKAERETPPQIDILVDQSNSMKAFDTGFLETLEDELSKEVPVNVKIIATADISDIGDQILASLSEDKNFLLVSDGRITDGISLGDVSIFARNINATINAIEMKPAASDVGVSVIGPTKTVSEAENAFLVETNVLNNAEYETSVYINDEPVALDSNGVFKKVFGTDGFYNIRAEVIPKGEDAFEENNIFYKTVRVVQKPKILYVSRKDDPLYEILRQLYQVQQSQLIEDNLNDYHAVVINDISAKNINNIDLLKEYLINGNGMLVIGGFDSFDRDGYKNTVFESLLPASVGTGEKTLGDSDIVIVIDVSGSTGGLTERGGRALEVQKALAVSIIDDLSAENRVAVVAFNTDAYLVNPLSPLYISRDDMINKISKLTFGGGTTISTGLIGANEVLRSSSGNGNVILISDGLSNGGLDIEKSKTIVKNMNELGIKTYTVGVGANTNEALMIELAQLGSGAHFRADETNKLNVLFGEVGDHEAGTSFGLVVVDSNHFITQDLNIRPVLDAFNQVIPKDSAQLLVATDFGNPAVTVWRYGVGRVAALTAFSTDDNLGTILNKENSVLLTRLGNWVIGDPERKLDYAVIIDDAKINEDVRVILKSKSYPDSDKVSFVKIDENTYAAKLKPDRTGQFEFLGAEYSVTYQKELEKLGMNPDLEFFVAQTSGKMFKPDEVENILEHVKSRSKRVRIVENSLQWLFLFAALAIFLTEVCIRRLKVK